MPGREEGGKGGSKYGETLIGSKKLRARFSRTG